MSAQTATTTGSSTTGRHDAPGWAVLGPGGIARRFLSQLPASGVGATIVAAGSSSPDRARAFATDAVEHGFADVAAVSYADALADPSVDAVYVSTVHTGHAALVLAALEAGKAVLCEKPLSPNHGTAMALADAARQAGLPLVEAYMYRFHPQTAALLDLVRQGSIGAVTHVDASFAFRSGDRTGRLFDVDTAGGGILDVGGYPVTMAAAIVQAATGVAAAEPTELTATGTLGPTGVDEWTVAHLTYTPGITASVRTGVRVQDENAVVVYGTTGKITLTDPWTLGEEPTIEVHTVDEEPRTLSFAGAHPYALEADATTAALADRRVDAPQMTLDESLAAARTLDRWRAAIDLRFPFEAETADIPTVSGRPLVVAAREPERTDVPMRYGEIAGVGKRMSRLVMGVDNQPDLAHASAIFDLFVEQGGNVFDTGYIYGGGVLEGRLGTWIRNRGVREDVVVITKGAHTPYCDPESLSRQLLESLERQGTDYADIYMMHRDDEDVPVGEFVDVLDEHRRAGRIRVYGGSNWSTARFDEANEYARANGRHEFEVLSNHFGLAEAYDVPWAGCRHATDAASKQWLEERQVPLLPWSSQARGFFTGRAKPEDTSDAELVRCYYSDENFERLRRASELGERFGVPATAIALAYVLNQPFPTFPLFGPRTIAEARSSMTGLSVDLTPEQVAWLDLRD
ncbi:aryl-alcohol dehydrogenase-like predicted oxidoreductase/predicted dehydrogenase [Curtobacterium pusillum]|uniref:Aryl-alcohol dehydrogenase-like predicted oxidoreductase/predicted dehydrogenase n=1 Tax=Curtobacterium pusillum TaxID=69373 RepID=A0AAW3T8D5_9MICO|nr:aldo/keto reductase [Curtobacterium pusillum]MBA8991220.1 aryl-alcohol dehydrogenase-like predicted oxidoreductase/predicted dehydrogenase [Curtobacterium pusillum]